MQKSLISTSISVGASTAKVHGRVVECGFVDSYRPFLIGGEGEYVKVREPTM